MSKKYKGKICVYCGILPSSEGDHVIARQFFPENEREGIPKVPACKKCNNYKSALETYLTALLPFGSSHIAAQKVLINEVHRRLQRNHRLSRELNYGSGIYWQQMNSGLILPTISFPIDEKMLDELIAYICKGLLWHHYSAILENEHFVKIAALSKYGEQYFKKQHFPNVNGKVWGDLGRGVFQYVGKQGKEYPQLSLWLMRFYTGVELRDKNSDDKSMCFVAVTGKKEVLERARLRSKFGVVI